MYSNPDVDYAIVPQYLTFHQKRYGQISFEYTHGDYGEQRFVGSVIGRRHRMENIQKKILKLPSVKRAVRIAKGLLPESELESSSSRADADADLKSESGVSTSDVGNQSSSNRKSSSRINLMNCFRSKLNQKKNKLCNPSTSNSSSSKSESESSHLNEGRLTKAEQADINCLTEFQKLLYTSPLRLKMTSCGRLLKEDECLEKLFSIDKEGRRCSDPSFVSQNNRTPPQIPQVPQETLRRRRLKDSQGNQEGSGSSRRILEVAIHILQMDPNGN